MSRTITYPTRIDHDCIPALIDARRAVTEAIGRRGKVDIDAMPIGYLESSLPTRKSIEAVARQRRRTGVTITSAVAAGRHYAACLHRLEVYRHGRRLDMSRGPGYGRRGRDTGRPAAVLAEQLDLRRRDAVAHPIDGRLANSSTHVRWVDTPEECGISVDSYLDHDGYSKRTKWAMKRWIVHVAAVRMQTRDLPAGEREHDGLVLLSATQCPSPDGTCRAWTDCRWLVRGRGATWHLATGAIVEDSDGTVVHGRTVERALATLRRRRVQS